MSLTASLLDRILLFCASQGITERQFGLSVAKNHKLIPRLRAGFGVNSLTHDRIMAFIEAGNGAQYSVPIPAGRKPRGNRVAAVSDVKEESGPPAEFPAPQADAPAPRRPRKAA